MLDLLGFWFNVTVLVIFLITPIFLFFANLVNPLVASITESERLGEKASSFIITHTEVGLKIFGKKVSESALLVATASGILSWAIFGSIRFMQAIRGDEGATLVWFVSWASEKAAPATGYVALAVLLWIGTIVIGRRVYKTYVKVNSALNKINEAANKD